MQLQLCEDWEDEHTIYSVRFHLIYFPHHFTSIEQPFDVVSHFQHQLTIKIRR